MFNPEQWVHCENITVKQFIEYLQENVPAQRQEGIPRCVRKGPG